MATDFGTSMNETEARIAHLEQKRVVGTSGISPVTYDDTGVPTVADLLDWSKSDGWESYTKITVATDDGTGAAYTSKFAMPAAHMTGRMCMLTGVVRRKTGATNLTAGTRYNLQMFGLPLNWRPVTNVILPCVMGNSDPSTGVVGTAQVEIRTGFLPTEVSGRVYYISGTLGCDANIGWIALQGSFPCKIVDVRDTVVMGSWGDAHFQESWDSVAEDLTWNDYGDYFTDEV
jgi:hypothetical protein